MSSIPVGQEPSSWDFQRACPKKRCSNFETSVGELHAHQVPERPPFRSVHQAFALAPRIQPSLPDSATTRIGPCSLALADAALARATTMTTTAIITRFCIVRTE